MTFIHYPATQNCRYPRWQFQAFPQRRKPLWSGLPPSQGGGNLMTSSSSQDATLNAEDPEHSLTINIVVLSHCVSASRRPAGRIGMLLEVFIFLSGRIFVQLPVGMRPAGKIFMKFPVRVRPSGRIFLQSMVRV